MMVKEELQRMDHIIEGHWHSKDTILFIDYLPRRLLYLILQSPFLQEVP